MPPTTAALVSLGICGLAAAAEGLAAGTNVKGVFAALRLPSYSPPLWAWYAIGALYYVACFAVLYRVLRYEGEAEARTPALGLLVGLMAVNALWNYVCFRARDLRLSFLAFLPYTAAALGLLVYLAQIDGPAAWCLLPYLVYLAYANVWGYRLWRLNRATG
jgi:translocator protein